MNDVFVGIVLILLSVDVVLLGWAGVLRARAITALSRRVEELESSNREGRYLA